MNKFIVKERRPDGFYRNPYRKGGKGLRWTQWKTVASFDTVEEATKAAIVHVGLAVRAVFYKGSKISDGPKIEVDWKQL